MDASSHLFISYNRSRKPQLNFHRHCPKPRTISSTLSSRSEDKSYSRSTLSSRSTSPPPRYARPTTASIARSFSTLPYFDNPVPTNPVYVAQLWRKVMAYNDDTQSSSSKQRVRKTQSRTSSKQTSDLPSSVPPKKATVPKIGDAEFRNKVLAKFGVYIRDDNCINSFYDHLGLDLLGLPDDRDKRLIQYTSPALDQQASHNQHTPKIPLLPGLAIWREPTEEYIQDLQREYSAMFEESSSEAEYQSYALEKILLNERRYLRIQSFPEQHLVPVRKIQLVQKPEPTPTNSTWKIPPYIPALNPGPKLYEWDIRPDCAYYISLRAFPEGYRSNVSIIISVIQDQACSAYLTIEFKKQNEHPCKAEHQVAVASALALYNRWCLKRDTIKSNNRQWKENDKSQMRHYGIIAIGPVWELWCTTPSTFDEWTGCTMFRLYRGSWYNAADAQRLLGALNDIHNWGLRVHGQSVVADVLSLLFVKGGRASFGFEAKVVSHTTRPL
ncbi:hypothetical protein F5Y09DRAFT_202268 [Xylaria sp. FL1042]|nr:hypothetical protein F5Y09DRAFT_202268 [Xylaria sp. FL1042]